MNTWQRSQPFCQYVTWRRRRRVMWLDTLRRNAANEHSAAMVDRLAKDWGK